MQKTILLMLIFISLQSFGQKTLTQKVIDEKKIGKSKSFYSIKGVSPTTAKLLIELKGINSLPTNNEELKRQELIADSTFKKKFGIINKEGINYVNAFLLVDEKFSLSDIKTSGFRSGSFTKKIVTGIIPIEKIEEVANHPNVKYLSIGELTNLMMDSTRSKTRTNLVHQGYQLPQAYFGNGVVVGIVDQGFDYTHPNFYDNTGANNYRVKKVWEQMSTTGTPPNGYAYGRELTTQTQILNAQRDVLNNSHGSHVTGIAAGAGGGASSTYMGIAPQADIILVSSDGIDSKLFDGVTYIMNYAASVNKPCVINLSWGGHYGPHDGTSPFDQASDIVVGPGRIIVGSAGNSGKDSIYLGKSYTSIDTSIFSFLKFPYSSLTTNGQATIDIWGMPNQNFKLAVNIYNTATSQFEAYTDYYSANINSTTSETLYDDDFFPDPCYLTITTEVSPLNNKPHIRVSIDNNAQDDNYRHVLLEILAKNTQTKGWSTQADAIFSSRGFAGVVDGSTNSTISETGGTGNSIISVGAYTSKNNYVALNGTTQGIEFPAPIGTIAPFSSKGPTADNRTKPDITAPGNAIISSVNSFDNNFTINSNNVAAGVTNGIKNWFFGVEQGTSMAAPTVTGIIALWLQTNPNLTLTQIKSILKDSSIIDAYTGVISNSGSNVWGWGKIDAYRGLKKALSSSIYTFNGNGNWNVPSNWTNNFIPPNPFTGGSILVDHTVGGNCVLNISQTILQAGSLTIKTGKNLLIQGFLNIHH